MSEPIGFEKRTTLRELLEKEQIFAPCVWDCFSARAAEMCGFKATLLSSGAQAWAMLGMPDTGMLTADECVAMTERIASTSRLPLIVDADEGYGVSPLSVYRTCHRLARAGAMAITIDDTSGFRGWERIFFDTGYKMEIVPDELFLAKIAAAVDAVKGTDCMIIARTGARHFYGFDNAIDRMVKATELGADMSMVLAINCLDDCIKINERVPGWKMYPDVVSRDGVPDVELEDIKKLGFNLVSMHYLEKAALYGMLDYGMNNWKNQNTVYSDEHDMGGWIDKKAAVPSYCDYEKWMAMEKKFREQSETVGKK
jgi:2-methylisocitrate lyase-like PEP mutase family enzyme